MGRYVNYGIGQDRRLYQSYDAGHGHWTLYKLRDRTGHGTLLKLFLRTWIWNIIPEVFKELDIGQDKDKGQGIDTAGTLSYGHSKETFREVS